MPREQGNREFTPGEVEVTLGALQILARAQNFFQNLGELNREGSLPTETGNVDGAMDIATGSISLSTFTGLA